MLDHQPIHIRDVQRSIRTRPRRREARPQIRRRKKLRRLLSRRTLADKRRAHRTHLFAMHQIVHGLADKNIPGHVRPEQVIAINRRTARRRKVVESVRIIKPRKGRARRKHPRRTRVPTHCHDRIRWYQVRIPPQVTLLERVVPKGVRVIATKPISPVVAAPAILRIADEQLDAAFIRLDAEIPPPHVHRALGFGRGDFPAALPVRQMHPTVERPFQTVREMLLVARRQTAKQHRRPIRPPVAVGILQKQHIRHRGHQHAVAPRQHRSRRLQSISEQRRPVVMPVAAR